tara:strand:- start:429 stop:1751 length:1323 start_codon:yes stop_codon:yes gene_type:complete
MINKIKNRVEKYIKSENLFSLDQKIILAISGGADSVCLMYIFLELGIDFELAHCNFNLRGSESEDDEVFIKELASKHKLKLHLKKINTQEYALSRNISIQMAARDIRYEWFNYLKDKNNAHYIATAHHLDDSIETSLLNFIRGTGINGLRGISSKRDNIVRPLLSLTRKEIEEYLNSKNFTFRNDSSNKSLLYKRNKIRHQLIPLLEEINPRIRFTISNNINRMLEVEQVFKNSIDKVLARLIYKKDQYIYVSKDELIKNNPVRTYLFELLKPYKFNQIDDIYRALDSHGQEFFSITHRLIIEKDELVISQINFKKEKKDFFISKNNSQISYPIHLRLTTKNIDTISQNTYIAHFDYEKLIFPLKLRKWKNGDKFIPLGMNNFKKLSDFFIDEKYSKIRKEQQWLLCSANDIIWIVGSRIDDRYKVVSTTKKLYIAELLK